MNCPNSKRERRGGRLVKRNQEQGGGSGRIGGPDRHSDVWDFGYSGGRSSDSGCTGACIYFGGPDVLLHGSSGRGDRHGQRRLELAQQAQALPPGTSPRQLVLVEPPPELEARLVVLPLVVSSQR